MKLDKNKFLILSQLLVRESSQLQLNKFQRRNKLAIKNPNHVSAVLYDMIHIFYILSYAIINIDKRLKKNKNEKLNLFREL